MAAPRSIWNGSITFGTVVVPVKLFSAAENRSLSFREVRARDGAPIKHQRIGAESGEEVPFKEIQKAYDTGRGVVVLTKDELAAADGPHPKVVAIEQFARAAEIDPVFLDKAYYVGAQPGGEHAYRVLLAGLARSERVGIGRFVLRSREQLVAVRPIGDVLGLQTMRYADELVAPQDLELPALRKQPSEREVAMAGQLVAMLAADWEPGAFHDTYRDAVLALIERKAAGQAITPARRAKQTEDDGLLAALEASLAGGSAAKGKRKAKPDAAAKPAKRAPTNKPTGPAAAPTRRAAAKRRGGH